MKKMPPLNSLKVFSVCIRHNTFTSAAEELSISQSAVSRHIKVLEDWFDTSFFQRSANGYSLTLQGKALAAEVQSVFDRLACLRPVIDRRSSNFRLNVPPCFASRWLIPRLDRTELTVGGKHLDLEVKTRVQADLMSHADAAIICSSGFLDVISHCPGLVVGCALPEYLTPMLSPRLMDAPQLENPGELASYTLLHTSADHDYWIHWFGSIGIGKDAKNEIVFDLTETAIQAAVHNSGVALLNPQFVDEELRTGQLVAPFENILTSTTSYFYVYSSNNMRDPNVLALQDWLITNNNFKPTSSGWAEGLIFAKAQGLNTE